MRNRCNRCKITGDDKLCDKCLLVLVAENVLEDIRYKKKHKRKTGKRIANNPALVARPPCFICGRTDKSIVYGDKDICIICKKTNGKKNNNKKEKESRESKV